MCATAEEITNAETYARNLRGAECNKESFDLQLMYGQWALDSQRVLMQHQARCEECRKAEAA